MSSSTSHFLPPASTKLSSHRVWFSVFRTQYSLVHPPSPNKIINHYFQFFLPLELFILVHFSSLSECSSCYHILIMSSTFLKPSDVFNYILGYVHVHLGSSNIKRINLLVILQACSTDFSLCVLTYTDTQTSAIEVLFIQVLPQLLPHLQSLS